MLAVVKIVFRYNNYYKDARSLLFFKLYLNNASHDIQPDVLKYKKVPSVSMLVQSKIFLHPEAKRAGWTA